MIKGFKSIEGPLTIGIRPLTILAGANSAGKSSAIQPLLLLKQTLEAAYDPGPLLLSGPNVNFTSVQQFLCKASTNKATSEFMFGVSMSPQSSCNITFQKGSDSPIELKHVEIQMGQRVLK